MTLLVMILDFPKGYSVDGLQHWHRCEPVKNHPNRGAVNMPVPCMVWDLDGRWSLLCSTSGHRRRPRMGGAREPEEVHQDPQSGWFMDTPQQLRGYKYRHPDRRVLVFSI